MSTSPRVLLQTVEPFITHELFESVGELGGIEVIRALRPLRVVYAVGHGDVW